MARRSGSGSTPRPLGDDKRCSRSASVSRRVATLARRTSFGFSCPLAVSLRKPRILNVGFPWISLSETRLINGLHAIFVEKFS